MTKRIFYSVFLAAVIVFSASLILIMGVLYTYFSSTHKKQLEAQTNLAAKSVELNGLDYLNRINSNDYRITWIDANGAVKFDNRASNAEMENHLEREEIKEALKTGTGISSRYSSTLMERQLYCAMRLSDGTVLRLSSSQYTWWHLILNMLQPILIIMIITVVLSLFLALRLSKNIVKPLNELNLDEPKSSFIYEELSPLVNRIVSQQLQLSAQSAELERKKEEFLTATRDMAEGIVLLNENQVILSINESASRLLGISHYSVGKDLLLFNNTPEIQELLHTAEGGRHCEITIPIEGANYQFNATPVISDGKVSGTALIIFDVTEKEKAEQIRREFTANVSHEMKTPLQSISGYAELLAEGMVKSEDVPKFLKRIYSESKRMISLVEDILKLSNLDEGVPDMQKESCNLYEIAEQTIQSLAAAADKNGITLSLEGKPIFIQGIPQLLSGILFNLCDNAIKYNKKNGSVTIGIAETDHAVKLSVSDTGIGIPVEQQSRIFERFYRVDKSRSREAGGTGLGLSIVKHAAKLHNAEIELQSTLDKGTSISLTFPK